MELCVGVETTEKLRNKLKHQINKALDDINVVTLIMAAMRVEEDFHFTELKVLILMMILHTYIQMKFWNGYSKSNCRNKSNF